LAKAKKRADGRYCRTMTVVEGGKKIRKFFYGSSEAELNRQMRQYREEASRGKLFSAVADDYWAQAEPNISPTTVDSYKRGVRRAAEFFGGVYIKDITPPMCDAYLVSIVKQYNMAKNTASNHRSVLNQIFVYAVQHGYCLYNPLRDIPIPKGLKKTPRKAAGDEDVAKIKQSLGTDFGLYAYMAMYTGLRKGELLGLTWDDIDLSARRITVHTTVYTLHGKVYTKPPKTESGVRTVPIIDKLLPVLEAAKDTGVVFKGKSGGYMTAWEYQDVYEKYKQEIGITSTAHQYRHSFATMLLEADIDVKSAQHLLGHAQASTTQDIYQEIRKKREDEVNSKLYSADL